MFVDILFDLVTFSPSHLQRDAFYQREDGGPKFERINMDIEHLCVGKVPCVARQPERPLVAYTKHLCGAATGRSLMLHHDIRCPFNVES